MSDETKTRYHPHDGGINQTVEPIYELTRAQLLEMIQRDARWRPGRLTAPMIGFDLIFDAGDRRDKNSSSAFNEFVKASGFAQVYSVMVDHRSTVGYTDRAAW